MFIVYCLMFSSLTLGPERSHFVLIAGEPLREPVAQHGKPQTTAVFLLIFFFFESSMRGSYYREERLDFFFFTYKFKDFVSLCHHQRKIYTWHLFLYSLSPSFKGIIPITCRTLNTKLWGNRNSVWHFVTGNLNLQKGFVACCLNIIFIFIKNLSDFNAVCSPLYF